MPRLLAACLALLLAANGWPALSAGYVESGRDSAAVYRAARTSQRSAGSQGYYARSTRSIRSNHQPAAWLSSAGYSASRQTPQAIPESVPEYRSRPVDAPPAFRLGQRPPPQNI